jgi:transcriptional regulator with XRE-family HTH domain
MQVTQAVDALAVYISQRQLEVLLGISQGYLSRLRSGKGNPSRTLVCTLASMALDAEVRVDELDRYCVKLLGAAPVFKRGAYGR